jgi:hypothetical protein
LERAYGPVIELCWFPPKAAVANVAPSWLRTDDVSGPRLDVAVPVDQRHLAGRIQAVDSVYVHALGMLLKLLEFFHGFAPKPGVP